MLLQLALESAIISCLDVLEQQLGGPHGYFYDLARITHEAALTYPIWCYIQRQLKHPESPVNVPV